MTESEIKSEKVETGEVQSEQTRDAAVQTSAAEEVTDFAALLERSDAEVGVHSPEPGQVVEGKIVQIGTEFVYVDLGLKGEATLPVSELLDPESGKLSQNVGDTIKAKIIKIGRSGIQLSRSLSAAGNLMLQDAFKAGTAVKAKVTESIKGGFSCEIAGKRAFCPISAIDVGHVEDTQKYVGQYFDFRIIKFERKGQNIVLSRVALLNEVQDSAREEILRDLEVGKVYEGTVSALMNYGAFVRLSEKCDIEGLLHLSEISYERVEKVEDALSVGDKVRVVVIKVEEPPAKSKNKLPRISLSKKQLEEDPVPKAIETLQAGENVEGVVTRTANFGVFVELLPGVEGLIHTSELSWSKGNSKNTLKSGQRVLVHIKEIDAENRRISLSLKGATENPWDNVEQSYELGGKVSGTVESVTKFGIFVKLNDVFTALIPLSEVPQASQRKFNVGDAVEATLITLDKERQRITLSLKDDAKVVFPSADNRDAEKKPREPRGAKPDTRKAKNAPAESYKDNDTFGTFGDLFKNLKK